MPSEDTSSSVPETIDAPSRSTLVTASAQTKHSSQTRQSPPLYPGQGSSTERRPSSLSNSFRCNSDSSPQNGTPASAVTKDDYMSLFQEEDWVEQELDIAGLKLQEDISDDYDGKQDMQFDEKEDYKNEGSFQDRIFAWLQEREGINHNDQKKNVDKKKNFHPSSSSSSSSSRSPSLSSQSNVSGMTKEVWIKTALNIYKDSLVEASPEGGWCAYPSAVRGALITEGSKGDISCINEHTCLLFVGELKNRDVYKVEDAIRQCACYLYHVLWWYRVAQGREIETVYGFCICGPKCKGFPKNIKQVAVTFLSLTMPDKIGGRMRLKKVHETSESNSFEMLESFRKLASFLKKDHYNPLSANKLKYRSPGCMMLPPQIAKDIEESGWCDVAESGTAALVLKVKLAAFPPEEDLTTEFLCEKFALTKGNAEDIAELIVQAKAVKEDFAYIKLCNAATGKHWTKKEALYHVIKYGVEAYKQNCVAKNPSCYLIFTYDMGVLLEDAIGRQLLPFDRFCSEYLALMMKTEEICDKYAVVHGDIHRENVLCKTEVDDGKMLSLVDWDESTMDAALERNIAKAEHKERYPAVWANDIVRYTKVQLFVLFRDVALEFYKEDVSSFVNFLAETIMQARDDLELHCGLLVDKYDELKKALKERHPVIQEAVEST